MAIDPSIPLAAKAPPTPSLLGQIGDVMTIQSRQLDQAQRVQAAGDEAALQQAMAANPNDPDAVSQTLQAAGHGIAALKFDAAIAEQRKRHIDTLKAETDLGRQQLEQGLQVVQGIKDQGTLSAAKSYLQQHVPQLAAVLPDQWDDPDGQGHVKAQQAVDYLRSVGMKAQEYNTWQNQLLDQLAKRPKTDQEWLTLTGQVMSGATTPELWGIYRNVLQAQGAPQSALGLVPQQFDPDAPARMADLGMTPEQRQKAADDRASIARSQASQAETRRHNAVMETQGQERIDRGGSGGGLSLAQRAVAERTKYAQLASLERQFKADTKDVYQKPKTGWRSAEDQATYDRAVANLTEGKLRAENSYRAQLGLDPVESGWGTPAVPGAPASAPVDAPLSPAKMQLQQQIIALAAQTKAEPDAAKRAALQAQGQQLLAQYDALR